jgi:hypothetical protein
MEPRRYLMGELTRSIILDLLEISYRTTHWVLKFQPWRLRHTAAGASRSRRWNHAESCDIAYLGCSWHLLALVPSAVSL